MRFVVFFVITVIAVLAGHVVAWDTAIGPLGTIVILALHFWACRVLSRRFGKAPAKSSVVAVPPEMVWTTFAASCLLGGGMGGMLAYNPDGYMQPRPVGPPWELIGLGTAAGAVLGLIAVALILLIARLTAPRVH